MIHGCALFGQEPPEPAKELVPFVVDTTRASCPEVDAKVVAEFGRTTPRPAVRKCKEGQVEKDGLCKADIKALVNRHEESERRKNEYGRALIAANEACRGDKPTS
jgi:hypothetical protein